MLILSIATPPPNIPHLSSMSYPAGYDGGDPPPHSYMLIMTVRMKMNVAESGIMTVAMKLGVVESGTMEMELTRKCLQKEMLPSIS
jgi:hypothetical protein